jgi:hypothetical protein
VSSTSQAAAIHAPPTPAEQLQFLRQLQRVLSEGSYTATYKYALLLALADLSVTRGDDSGAPLELTTREIAEVFIRLYWPQASPFAGVRMSSPEVLRQNTKGQAEIIQAVSDAQSRYEHSLAQLQRRTPAWQQLVSRVDRVLKKQPLWRLQRLGDEIVPFLYEQVGTGNSITIRPGVAYCFRTFYTLIVDLVQGAWLRYVRRVNAPLLAENVDLAAFLFGAERNNLSAYPPLLFDLQEGRCFYCQRALRGMIEVDHFIPWARYPVDLGHDFVLADSACNRAKADFLAGEDFLSCWLERNRVHQHTLAERFNAEGIVHDLPSSELVARWAYGQVATTQGHVWLGGKVLGQLSSEWEEGFAVGRISTTSLGPR